MKTSVSVILVCLLCAFPTTAAHAQELPTPDLKDVGSLSPYCAGLVGNSLAFAFASGVSVAVPALSAGFLAASVAFAIAAVAVC